MSVSRKMLAAVAATGLTAAATAPAAAPAFAETLVEAGELTCSQGPREAARDPNAVHCVFTSADGRVREYYAGYMDRGLPRANGAERVSVTWRVTTRTRIRTMRRGAVAGTYGDGDTGEPARPGSVGVLTGGPERVITLRPTVTVEQPAPPATRLTLRRVGSVEETAPPDAEIEVEPLPRR